MERHIFALYYSHLSKVMHLSSSLTSITIHDEELLRRIVSILRLSPGEEIVFFDAQIIIKAQLGTSVVRSKKSFDIMIIEKKMNTSLLPTITLVIGLPKPSALEEIAALTVQLGATCCIPVITAKTQRKWGGNTEKERLKRIMIAAAEQSKNYSLPEVKEPSTFSEFVATASQLSHKKAYFEREGAPLLDLINDVVQSRYTEITLFVGPEGGITQEEQAILESINFKKYTLTPTVLRSVEAVAVGLGSVRSVTTFF